MTTVFCDALGLAASDEVEERAFDKLQQTLMSFSHTLRRKAMWERALNESGIDWIPIEITRSPNEVVYDI